MKAFVQIFVLLSFASFVSAQKPLFEFGENVSYESVLAGKKVKSESLQWFQVNTRDTTWEVQNDLLICYGHPIGAVSYTLMPRPTPASA